MVSFTWEKGTNTVTELAMDTKCRRASPTRIDVMVYPHPKRCERGCRIILTDVLAELMGQWRHGREEITEFLRGRRHGG